jgi:hypothetical protein
MRGSIPAAQSLGPKSYGRDARINTRSAPGHIGDLGHYQNRLLHLELDVDPLHEVDLCDREHPIPDARLARSLYFRTQH